MKQWLIILLAVISSTSVFADGGDALVIDMRDGLSESRVRQIKQMPDGRMAIATSATIDVFDGSHFTSYALPPELAYPLPRYHGNRQLTCDVGGRVWLRNEQTLYVVDTRRRCLVHNVDSLMKALHLKERDIVDWPQTPTPYKYEGIDDVTAVERDCYGGLWIGTRESGIIYSNARRQRQFATLRQRFAFQRIPNHGTARARRLEAAFAPQATNCMLADGGRYAYLGTRHGIMVFGRDDRLVATLDGHDGLHTDNVEALIRDNRGDVWASTANGISRIHVSGRDSFDITNYGRLDGIDVGGGEFRPGQMHKDSDGVITVGFADGIVRFQPDSVNAPRYTFHFPRAESVQQASVRHYYWLWLLVAGFLLVTVGLYLWRRRRVHSSAGQQANDFVPQAGEEAVSRLKETAVGQTADDLFLAQLHKTVDDNIGDEDFSVQTLSGLMAMDRTTLFRRMQALTGMSPSNYIRSVRMDAAARLLRETTMPAAEIAVRTGFSTTKYFNKVFKETFSVSPAEYRKDNFAG